MTSRSNEFQRFLATEFTRMEQNIIDFSNQQDVFCGEFRRSLESEVERRNRDLAKLSQSLGKMLETQLKTVRKFSFNAEDFIKVWVSEKCSKKYSKKHSTKFDLLKKGLKKVNALF